jgi:hypothetical protein
MKIFCATVGLLGFLVAGSANADVVYDTLTGQTETNRLLLYVQKNHAPMGDAFSLNYAETIQSVTVQLIDPVASTNITDTGSVLVYLVPSISNEPLSTGVTLTNKIFLGSIADSSLLGGSVINNETLSTNVSVAAGNYWIVLTSGSDPNNFYQTVNPVPTTAGWAEFAANTAVGAIGLPTSNFAEVTNPTNTGFLNDVGGYVFVAQVQAPEPASLVMLGSGLMGLGLSRRRLKNHADLSTGV